ncbi:unnamed protein product [Schistosoma mattheei]|uniref:Uncharacterized protein n=1 Tax=Schistosoma mattheei TaxID=31246 RepID=A0A183Q074_9TREM|nr:unnamed protein product [Schistosoma mattheei]
MFKILFSKIWDEEQVPTDWKEGLLVKIPKKGDLSKKSLQQGIVKQNEGLVDAQLRDQQAGLRKDRSCTDQIATPRIIVEKSTEWNSLLYINFIDFEKAFDSVDRTTLLETSSTLRRASEDSQYHTEFL